MIKFAQHGLGDDATSLVQYTDKEDAPLSDHPSEKSVVRFAEVG